jgi:hypothetical protein
MGPLGQTTLKSLNDVRSDVLSFELARERLFDGTLSAIEAFYLRNDTGFFHSLSFAERGMLQELAARVLWCDVFDEPETEGESPAKVVDSLIHAIKQGGKGVVSNKVLLPSNLEREVPALFRAFQAAAKVARMEIVSDVTKVSRVGFSDIFSVNGQEQAVSAATSVADSKTQKAIASGVNLLSILIHPPTEEGFDMSAPGRCVLAWAASLILEVIEVRIHKREAKYPRLAFGATPQYREVVSEVLKPIFPEDGPRERILAATDVLLRRIVDERLRCSPAIADSLYQRLSKVLLRSGQEIAKAFFNSTKELKRETDPKTRKVSERQVTRYVLPRVDPQRAILLPVETPEIAKYNRAFDTRLKETVIAFNESIDPSIPDRIDNLRAQIKDLYSKNSVVSALLAKRRDCVRAHGYEILTKEGSRTTTSSGSQVRLSPELWEKAQNQVLAAQGPEMHAQLLEAIGNAIASITQQ